MKDGMQDGLRPICRSKEVFAVTDKLGLKQRYLGLRAVIGKPW